jgi:hypothetical protein
VRHQILQWTNGLWAGDAIEADVVFAFLDPAIARKSSAFNDLKKRFPHAKVIGCTTGGEIAHNKAHIGGGFAAALSFDQVDVRAFEAKIVEAGQSQAIAAQLAQKLIGEDLCGVYIVSDGARVNGSALVAGFRDVLGPHVSLNGGLAGDSADFGETLVGCSGGGCSGNLEAGTVVAVGFYGAGLRIRTGSFGGWEAFGPKRKITKSAGNQLFQLDGKSALELYKRYLGDDADGLPSSALFYPLQISAPGGEETVVRTILGIDEATGGMTFAGDMPEGWSAQFMAGERSSLIEGAAMAGRSAQSENTNSFALLVSCIGRRLVLGQRATEEVRAVVDALGGIAHAGFYSYGEISPNGFQGTCNLHNQTMAVTVFEAA